VGETVFDFDIPRKKDQQTPEEAEEYYGKEV